MFNVDLDSYFIFIFSLICDAVIMGLWPAIAWSFGVDWSWILLNVQCSSIDLMGQVSYLLLCWCLSWCLSWCFIVLHNFDLVSLLVRHLVKVEIKPDLVLSAEKELGIIAGLQDRVAQVYGGLVYMVCDVHAYMFKCS